MTLQDFISNFDKENTIILLEGKREVPDTDKEKLISLGKLLAQNTKFMKFRSGNADGSDYLFSSGVSSVDPGRLQVITPYKDHRKKYNQATETISLDQIDLALEPEVAYLSKKNNKTKHLIDPYLAGEKNQYIMKAAYIIRDTIKVTGTKKIPPAAFGIFYDDLKNPRSGGTGHTMNICKINKIPHVDQTVWFEWLNE